MLRSYARIATKKGSLVYYLSAVVPLRFRSHRPFPLCYSLLCHRSLLPLLLLVCLDAVALKLRCEGNRVIMGLYHLPSTQPAWTRREPGGAHENPETIIRPTALDLST